MGWVRIDDSFYDHPKFHQVGALGLAAWISGLAYANRNLTNGFIPRKVARVIIDCDGLGLYEGNYAGRDAEASDGVDQLVAAGLWHEVDAGYQIHDYLDYQPSADQVRAAREKNAERQARWRKTRDEANDGASNTAPDDISHGASNAATNAPVTGAPNPNPKGSSNEEPFVSVEPPRTDVERLCRRLAELMVENGCKPPQITDRWRKSARLLLDTDRRPLDEALAVVRWAQESEFWRGNIQSLPKFREKYDQLRLQMDRKPAGQRGYDLAVGDEEWMR